MCDSKTQSLSSIGFEEQLIDRNFLQYESSIFHTFSLFFCAICNFCCKRGVNSLGTIS